MNDPDQARTDVAEPPIDDTTMALQEHCVHAFDALISHLHAQECPPPSFPLDGSFPMFVTWNVVDGYREPRLRGCIGTLKPVKITAIKDYAITSAVNDRRFPPIKSAEVKSLSCTVSLLIEFETADAWDDWAIGTHGIWIDFTDGERRDWSATYLPDVCSEQGWTKVECVNSLIRKAGFRGQITEELRRRLRVTRYQSTLAKLDYGEYTALDRQRRK